MSVPASRLQVDRRQLPNGLKVNLHRDPSLPLVAINLWYHVGSKNERPGRTGFAHLFEHMLFQGSQHIDTNGHFQSVQQVGGIVNGSTWYDRTNYYETLPASHLGLGLWLESDRMGFLLPAMTPEKLENQRNVVMNERRQRIDNRPYGIAHERLHELLYPADHPYHWPVIGYMEDIAAATMEDVQSFFRTYYAPNNAVLTLAGDFESESAFRQIEDYFGPIASAPLPDPPRPTLAPMTGERRDEIADEILLSRVYIAFHAPAYGHRLWYAADLLTTALTGGKSSPLYQDLVYRREIAQDISMSLLPTELSSMLYVVATCKPGVSPAILEEAILEHLAEAATRVIPAEHLERARNQVLNSFYRNLQALDRRADAMSEFTVYFDDPEGVNDEARSYLDLSPQDLLDYASKYWLPKQKAVVTFVPKNGESSP